MPIMPTAADLTPVTLRSRSVTEGVKDYVGEAVQRAGGTVTAIEQRRIRMQGEQDDALDLARARAAWAQGSAELEAALNETDTPDHNTWGKTYKDRSGKMLNGALGLIRNPVTREKARLDFQTEALGGQLRVDEKARERNNSLKAAEVYTGLDKRMRSAADPRVDPKKSNAMIASVRRDLQNLRDTGVLTPAQAAEMTVRIVHEHSQLKLDWVKTLKGPHAALAAITGGAGEGFMLRLRTHESGNDKNAKPRKADGTLASSAEGVYQITDETWAGLMKNHPELGLTEDGRMDDTQAEVGMRALIKEYEAGLKGAGLPVTEQTLYIAHFMGVPNGVKMLKGDQNKIAADVFPDSAKSNPNVFYDKKGRARTVGEVVAVQSRHFSNAVFEPQDWADMLDPTIVPGKIDELRKEIAVVNAKDERDADLNEARAYVEDVKKLYPADRRAAESEIKENLDGQVREHALDMLKADYDTEDRLIEDTRVKDKEAAFNLITQSMEKGDLATAKAAASSLSNPFDRAEMEKYVRSGGNRVNEQALVDTLNKMMIDEPEKFKKLKITDYITRLDDSSFKYYAEMQKTYNDPDLGASKVDDLRGVAGVLEDHFRIMKIAVGKDATSASLEFTSRVTLMVQKSLEQLERQLGRKPTPSEMQGVISETFKNTSRPGGFWDGGFTQRDSVPITLKDVYDEFAKNDAIIEEAADDLRASGFPVNPESLRNWLKKALDRRGAAE